ncbi:glycosyltransferase family 2 protein [Azonexus sp. IMCC34842]|uniref:glycosyltransferase family 2 protein n=1 Tax=Azonexus sp. IMCC34842 TaxID=3420950 RepID=UPI003D0B4A3B
MNMFLPTSGTTETDSINRVSVVMPTHNRAALFAEALSSVCTQTWRQWDVVIVDDASTPAVVVPDLPEFSGKFELLRNGKSIGGAASKAAGTYKSDGDVIAYLDDDDLYQARFLESAVDVLNRYPEVDVLFMGVDWFGNNSVDEELGHESALARVFSIAQPMEVEADLWRFDQRLLAALLRTVPMCFQRPVVRRSALEKIGLHRSDCLLWDCEWALRAALVSRCALLNRPLYRQRVDGQGYHSLPDRVLAQLRSGAEMTLRLYRDPPAGVSAEAVELLKEAASRYTFDLAYALSKQGSFKEAMHYWLLSQQIQPELKRLKFLFGALARAVGRALKPKS